MLAASGAQTTLEHILRTERATLKFRLLALLVAALAFYLSQDRAQFWPTVGLLLAYLTYIMLLGRVIIPRLGTYYIVYGMIVVDTLALGAGLYLAGGPTGPLFILLPLFIIYYAMFRGYPTALFSATTFSLAYVALTQLSGLAREAGPIIATQVPFLFVAAILAGYLSQRRLEERREKEELQELVRVHAHAQSLLQMTRALSQTWDLAPTLQQVVSHLPGLLGLPHCLVALLENGKLVARAGNLKLQEVGLNALEELVIPSIQGATAQALEKAVPVTLNNADSSPDDLPDWARKLGVVSLLAVPLMARGQKLGLIYLFDTSPRTFSEEDISLAQTYGEVAANALANAQFLRSAQAQIQETAGQLESTVHRMDRLSRARRQAALVVGDLHIDGARERVTVQGKPVELSPTEFELLYVLAENAGQPVNQETLLRRVWGEDYRGQGNVVDVSIHRLRRKLGGNSAPHRILTVRGRGYMLPAPPPR